MTLTAVGTAAQDDTPAGLTPAEWDSIQTLHDAGRHAVRSTATGFQARNRGQQWATHFDGQGITIQPDNRAWNWGLQLHSYGLAGHERSVTLPQNVHSQGSRVSYSWDQSLTEWFVNDGRGLEHGYTLHQPPTHLSGLSNTVSADSVSTDTLILSLEVRGDLLPVVSSDGQDVHFVNADGHAVLDYTGLLVTDADGRALKARFSAAAPGLRLTVDVAQAHYPITIDPLVQQAYLKASNTASSDFFGQAVAVSGDTVVVSAFFEDSGAVGVNGDETDNTASNSGAAYVFVRSGSTWTQQAYLKASNTGSQDQFGISVAISGDTVVVGATSEDSNATVINGDGTDNSASHSGAAYVFTRSGTTWSQQAYLKASNANAVDEFGISVAIDGDTVLVGADLEDSNATGANGDASDNSALGSGAAYVFVRSGTTWTQQAYLKASNTQGGAPFGDRFGYSVSLSDDTAVISALDEDSDATGVNGNQLDNNFSSSGAAYVFVRSGTSWAQQAYLKASNTGFDAAFGISTSISGDTLVIGAEREDNSAAGVNGNQTAGFLNNSGAAYVFVRSGSTWIQQAYLKASSSGAGDQFGRAVAISGDRLAVGAPFEDSIATGVDGDQSDNSFSSAGATYVFERSASTWSQLAYLKASNTGPGDNFGRALALSGGTLIVSSYLEDSSATGVDGDQSDNSVSNSGAAYVFDLGGDPWVDLGSAMAGTHGDPLLEGSGSLMVGDTVTLSLSNALESSTTFFVIGLAEVNLPFYGGTLVPSFEAPLGLFIALPTDGAGELVLSDTWPTGIPSGTDLFFQHWIVDGGAAFGFAGSNAVKGTTP